MNEEFWGRIILLAVMVGAAVLLFWMAHATASGKVGRNHVAGIRIPSTMASDEAWLAAHQRAKVPTMWAGIASLASGMAMLLPLPMPTVAVIAVVGCVAILGFTLYGAWVGSSAAKAVTANSRGDAPSSPPPSQTPQSPGVQPPTT